MKKKREKEFGTIKGPYRQKSIIQRIEALFLDNIGKVITGEKIIKVAKDPRTGKEPENWHQRLSELRTDYGYTILSARDRRELKVSEYLMPNNKKRPKAGRRIRPKPETWKLVLKHSNDACEWMEDGILCGLKEGDNDPIGGGTVRLTPDHKTPHCVNPDADPVNPNAWRALCGRHQVMKKNYWDDTSGWLNVQAIVQSASAKEKRAVFSFLKSYFRDEVIPRKDRISLLDLVKSASEKEKRSIFNFLCEYFSKP